MIEYSCPALNGFASGTAIINWLKENMPNPLEADKRRWWFGYETTYKFLQPRPVIQFSNDEDATFFALRWGGNENIKE